MKGRARQLRYQGDIDRYSGKMGQVMGYTQAAGTVLEHGEEAAEKMMKLFGGG
jgi:hypothetical protein